MSPTPIDEIWYLAYGSNMQAARLGYYLAGGTPPGARRSYPGCRDPRPPRRSVPVMLPGGIYFALESRAWTGGMAFYDPALPGQAAARAYLVTAGQFADILAQEMYTRPGIQTDLAAVIEHGRARLGPGRYETMVCAGHLDDRPLLTFTAPWTSTEVVPTSPAPVYLAMITAGLREAHGWDAGQIIAYLYTLAGIRDRWSHADLAALVTAQCTPVDRVQADQRAVGSPGYTAASAVGVADSGVVRAAGASLFHATVTVMLALPLASASLPVFSASAAQPEPRPPARRRRPSARRPVR